MNPLRERMESAPIRIFNAADNPVDENNKLISKEEYYKRANERWVAVSKFAENYEQICEEIFQEISAKIGSLKIHFGNFRIVWLGGRIEGKSVKHNTDLDLVFCFDENSGWIGMQTALADELLQMTYGILRKHDVKVSDPGKLLEDINILLPKDFDRFISDMARVPGKKYEVIFNKKVN